MPSDGKLTFDTRIDTTGFEQGLDSMKRQGSTVGDFIKGQLGAELIRNAAGKLAEFGKTALEVASNLEEVQNVVDVTFGGNAGAIDRWARQTSASVGLTELQAKQFSGTIGAMVKSMGLSEESAADMAMSLADLTGDLASFYNLDHETAFQKIRSGISGETEPLKQIGINLSVANLEAFALAQGIETAYDKMSESERVQLRYQYLMQATADAQGDFARTSDGYANQVRVLQNNLNSLAGNIGAALLPAVTAAVSGVNSLFNLFAKKPVRNYLSEEAQAAASDLQALTTDIDGFKRDYADQTIQVKVKAQRGLSLLAMLYSLKEINAGTAEASARMVEITNSLTDLYPELAKYVGRDGILQAEREQVEGLVQSYADLALERAKERMVNATGDALIEGLASMQILLEEGRRASDRKSAADREYLAAEKAFSFFLGDAAEPTRATFGSGYAEKGTPSLQADLYAILDEFIKAFGKLPEALEEEFAVYNAEHGTDLGADKFTGARNASELDQEGYMSMLVAYRAMAGMGVDRVAMGAEMNELLSEKSLAVDEALSTMEAAGAAIEKYQPVLADLAAEYDTTAQSYVDAVSLTSEETAAALKANVDSINSSMRSTFLSAQRYIRQLNGTTVRVNVVANGNALRLTGGESVSGGYLPGHATGLSYVPYDNYGARLHRGERVLTEQENRQYTAGAQATLDYQKLSGAVAAAMERSGVGNSVLTLDGRELARVQAGRNRAAQKELSRREALGLGKG